jgi:hypothetical protein
MVLPARAVSALNAQSEALFCVGDDRIADDSLTKMHRTPVRRGRQNIKLLELSQQE